MKNKTTKALPVKKKQKNYLKYFLGFIFMDLLIVGSIIMPDFLGSTSASAETETIAVKPVESTILATGQIESQNEATLHFQTGGKLAALPVKEGDKVSSGQTIAQLDTYALQRQLTSALNTYRSTRDSFDQTQQNSSADVLQNQQNAQLNQTKTGVSGMSQDAYVNDVVQRIVDQNQATLDNSVVNVELAHYALQMSALTAPFTGVVTHEDVTSAGVNVSPQTSFVVADPNNTVFRAMVSDTDIPFVLEGQPAVVTLDGKSYQHLNGTVSKIYPEKVTLPTGESVYQVDITVDGLSDISMLKEKGSVLIQNRYHTPVTLVPSWTVLNGNSVWVMQGDQPVLKNVAVGDTSNNTTEIMSGLSSGDRVIVNPRAIAKQHYILL